MEIVQGKEVLETKAKKVPPSDDIASTTKLLKELGDGKGGVSFHLCRMSITSANLVARSMLLAKPTNWFQTKPILTILYEKSISIRDALFSFLQALWKEWGRFSSRFRTAIVEFHILSGLMIIWRKSY
jgi:hypothetical protein